MTAVPNCLAANRRLVEPALNGDRHERPTGSWRLNADTREGLFQRRHTRLMPREKNRPPAVVLVPNPFYQV